MSSVSEMISTQSSELLEFTDAFQLIGLSIGEEKQYRLLTEFVNPDEIARQLAHQTKIQINMDVRTQGTYFISSLSGYLADVISLLDLNYLDLENTWERLAIKENLMSTVHEGVTYQYVLYGWQLPELSKVQKQQDAHRVGQRFLSYLTPFIEEVRQQTGMAKGALWRLVTDAITASYLSTGKKLDKVSVAMERASTIINEAGGLLANRKWHFKEYSVDENMSPNGRRLNDWFRVRGGCCRYYTLSGGEYCSTCIHVPENEREVRLKRHLTNSVVCDLLNTK